MNETSSFEIHGGKPLSGSVGVSGAKNAALKMIAAATLTDETVVLHNVPKIKDVLTLLDIMTDMGAEISWSDTNTLSITCTNLDPEKLDQNKVGRLRGSVVLIGPLVARFKKLRIHEPGGCHLGVRPITTHVRAIQGLGVTVTKEGKYYTFECDELIGHHVTLDELSVTTTENLLMAATLAKGVTHIHVAASEPEIGNLVDQLVAMGAKIDGKGTHDLVVTGVDVMSGADITVIPDRIEIGTYACAIAATKGEATITNVIPAHLYNLLNKFNQIGIPYSYSKSLDTTPDTDFNDLRIGKAEHMKAISFDTRPYPGFSTDVQSPMVVLLTQAEGVSTIYETLFEGRMEYTKQLTAMGANMVMKDNRTVEITGPSTLTAGQLEAPDIRAGAAFVIAGLIANGITTVTNAPMIDRGYEHIEEKLTQLGAQIVRK